MSLSELLRAIGSVRKCAGCGRILPNEAAEQAFCSNCRRIWSEAETHGCPSCFAAAVECTCMPRALAKSGALCLRKAVFYRKTEPWKIENRLILRLKDRPNRRMERFVARELAVLAREELALLEAEPSQAVVTYLPRGRAAKRRAGLDQGERMAEALSEVMDIPMVHALARRGSSRSQKALGVEERVRNTEHKIIGRDTESIDGKIVLLYDDVAPQTSISNYR